MFQKVFSVFIQLFFMLTPFFVLTMFMTLTADCDERTRKSIGKHALISIVSVCLILFFFGQLIFRIFGITLDAFRIGAGVILLLSAIELVRGVAQHTTKHMDESEGSIAVVPLTIPYVVGPGTIGMLLVMGAEEADLKERLCTAVGIVLASASVGLMLYYSSFILKILKKSGLQVLSKITGLVLAAIAAQSIFAGLKNILGL